MKGIISRVLALAFAKKTDQEIMAQFKPYSTVTALGSEAPSVAIGPRHTPNDGRGPRDVYVDGILAPNCLEADTAEGWAILHREAGPGEFAPGGVQFTRRGKVQVFPAGTVRP